ncbi:alpha/beta hydrolase fold domain-containing protein [Paenibacillus pinihumi]|uniref:alpha/beta hydrolase fold domain-containing protein n=1 Tax=Paenibacillus pinihumi TaxID=669462 RepID=UPI0003F759CA|nr:alpha/beta hydrolase fold domain-containing protein [Paenibacillus pinihumi]
MGKHARLILWSAAIIAVIALLCVLGLKYLTNSIDNKDTEASWLLEPVFKIQVQTDIVFAVKANERGKEEQLELDVYEPVQEGKAARPLILFIHGGGFNSGDKSDAKAIAEEWASRGYAVASINYRLRANPQYDMKGTLSDALADIQDALNWLYEHQDTYRIDTKYTAIGGDSAGGLLAAAYANQFAASGQNDSVRLFAVIDIYGPLLGGKINVGFPSTLIIHGTADAEVLYDQSLLLSDKLGKAGVYNQLVTLQGGWHNYQDPAYWQQVVQSTVHFLRNAISTPDQSFIPGQIEIGAFAGDTAEIPLIRKPQHTEEDNRLQVSLPKGWKLAGSDSLASGQNPAIQIPEDARAGIYPLLLKTGDKGSSALPLAVYIKVQEPLSIARTVVYDKASRQIQTLLTVTNQSPRALQGTLGISSLETEEQKQETYPLELLQPGASSSLTLANYADDPQAIAVLNSSGAILQETAVLTYVYVAEKLSKPLTIDGSLEDWKLEHPFPLNRQSQLRLHDYNGPDDLSGLGWVAWDESYVYIALQIKDDQHVQQEVPVNIYLGDSVQLGFRLVDENGRLSGVHEFGAALLEKGTTTTFRWLGPRAFKPGPMNNMRVGITRHDQETIYELAILREELGADTFLEGTQLKFSLLVNDNDGSGRKGWMEYNSGIGHKNPEAFGDLFLLGSP